MSDIIHQFNDPSLKMLVSLSRLNPWAKEHIKEASVSASYGDELPDSAFAWEDRRLFPIDTPANTLVSKFYIEKQAEYVPDFVKEAVDAALLLYAVEPRDIVVELQEKQAGAVDYVFPESARWEVEDAEDVKLAESQLFRMSKEIPFMEKTGAAVRLCQLAEKHDTRPSMRLLKMAGAVAADLNQTIDWLEARAILADEDTSPHYTKLAAELLNVDPLCYSRGTLVKLAALIHDLDLRAGLEDHYDVAIPDPVSSVFNTEKLAEETIDVAGKSVPLSKFASIPPEVWGQLLDTDADSVLTNGQVDTQKIAAVVPTLPRDIKIVLRRYL